jgi:hypothetical protein
MAADDRGVTRDWPAKVETEWVPEREVHESGLLAHINRSVLWPLGMALAVTATPTDSRDEDGVVTTTYEYEPGLRILRNVPFDPIAGEESPAETEANMRRFAEWLVAGIA